MLKFFRFIFKSFSSSTKVKLEYPSFWRARFKVNNHLFLYLVCSSFIARVAGRLFFRYLHRSGRGIRAVYRSGYTIRFPFLSCLNNWQDILDIYYDEYLAAFADCTDFDISIDEGDNVIDIGAHIGTFCIPMAACNGANVIAIEPSISNYACLQTNVLENSLTDKVSVIHGAVFGRVGSVEFIDGDATTRGSVKDANFFRAGSGSSYEVSAYTLDFLVNKFSVDKIKLLKMDCEGSEYEIFKTFTPDLFSRIHYLIFELHLNLNEEQAELKIENILNENGFSFSKKEAGFGCIEYFCVNPEN